MSTQTCLTRLLQFVDEKGLKISRDILKQFAEELDQAKGESLSREAFNDRASVLFQDQIESIAAIRRAQRRMQVAKDLGNINSVVKENLGEVGKAANLRNLIEGGAIAPSIGGRIDPVKAASFDSNQLAKLWNQGIGPFKKLIKTRMLLDEIFQEREALEKGLTPGQSGSQDAVSIARVMYATSQAIFELKKAYNPFLQSTKDFITNRIWDRVKVSQIDKPEFVQFLEQNYGQKSFPDVTDPVKRAEIFGSIYERIRDGTYGSVLDGENADKFVGEPGKPSILSRMARSRTLVANDWKAEASSFKQFGPETISDLMGQVIDRTGKDVALLSKWGPSPQEAYETVYQGVFSRATGAERQELTSAKPMLDGLFRQTTGVANAPASNWIGKTTRGLTNGVYAAKAAASFWRILSDVGFGFLSVRSLNGESILSNGLKLTEGYAKAFVSSEDRLMALQKLGIYAGAVRANILGAAGSVGDGRFSTVARLVAKWGGHEIHAESAKAAMGGVIANELAEEAGKAFQDLSPRWQNGLQAYGIQPPEWDFIRSSGKEEIHEGLLKGSYLTPDAVDAASPQAVSGYLASKGLPSDKLSPEMVFRVRRDVSRMLGLLINDHADYGSLTPGSRQKGFMFQGRDINDPRGAALRLLFQFKAPALTAFDAYKRAFYSAGGTGLQGDWAGIAQGAAAVAFTWGLGRSVTNALQNKSPEDPFSPRFIAEAAIASGVGGLALDPLLGVVNSTGARTVPEYAGKVALGLTGPAISEVAQGVGIAAKYIEQTQKVGIPKYPNRQLFQWVENNAPALNLLGAKGALDYYFLNGAKEFLDTGYLMRLQQNIMKEPGRNLLTGEAQPRYYLMGGPAR